MSLNRRNLMKVGAALSLGILAKSLGVSLAASNPVPESSGIQKITKTDEEWKALLTPEQYQVLRHEGRSGRSPMNIMTVKPKAPTNVQAVRWRSVFLRDEI